MSSKPLVFSYQRFSSPQQAKGDSIRRQTVARDAFLKRHELTLAEGFQFKDEGVSSFRGRHRDDRYDLGRFLSLVKAKSIPPGSYLIVESLDRLSREHIQPALRLILNLLEAGVRIVQLLPVEQIFDDKSDTMHLMLAMIELSRGNSESKVKSERLAAVWQRKREQARETRTIATSMCPLWLKLNEDTGKFDVDPDHAATVRLIYELCADGFGINQIIKRLVREKRPVFAKSGEWSACYVGMILRNRATIGEYQPRKGKKPDGDPIPNYFPPVVSEPLFARVSINLDQRRRIRDGKKSLPSGGGRVARGINLFRGLLRHAIDGDAIEYKWFGRWACYCNAKSLCGLASHVSFPVAEFERAVLTSLTEIASEDILPEQSNEQDETVVLTAELNRVRTQLKKIEDSLVAGVSLETLTAAAVRLERKYRELEKQLADVARRCADPQSAAWMTARTLIATLDAAPDPEAARTRLQSVLRRITEKINCLFVRDGRRQIALVQMYFRGAKNDPRTIAIRYRGELANRKGVVPEYRSADTIKRGPLQAVDLRKPSHVTITLNVLRRLVTKEEWRAWEPVQPKPQPRPQPT